MATRSTVISSFFWRFLEQFGNQAIQFITQILLARLLIPEEFGLIAMIAIFIALGRVFVDAGFGQALIQSKTLNEVDKSSIFLVNIIVAIIIYALIFLASPFIASFYDVDILTVILRVQSIIIIINAFAIVQRSILLREMQFKMSFKISLIATIVQGSTGVSLAYFGFGVWALVFSQISWTTTNAVLLWIFVKWIPKNKFSLSRIRTLSKFGIGILGTSLLNSVFANIHSIVIGKSFSAELLGFYNRGESLPKIAINTINEPVKAVIFSKLSKMQDDHQSIKNAMRRIMLIGSFFIFPMMLLLAITAKPLVSILLTDKWLFCVPFVQLATIKYAFAPMHSANLEAIKSLGRSDIFFRLSVIKNSITVIILLITLPFGIYTVAVGSVFASIISLLINLVPNNKLIQYSLKEQMKDILPNLLLTTFTGVVVLMIVGNLELSKYTSILLSAFVGATVFIGTAAAFKLKSLNESLILLRTLLPFSIVPEK